MEAIRISKRLVLLRLRLIVPARGSGLRARCSACDDSVALDDNVVIPCDLNVAASVDVDHHVVVAG